MIDPKGKVPQNAFRKIQNVVVALSLFALLCFPISAHPGKTDSAGGHYDQETGSYHYHHGYPAHQHTDRNGDGIPDCPYSFDDRTGWNSGSSGATSATTSEKVSAAFVQASAVSAKAEKTEDSLSIWITVVLVGGILLLTALSKWASNDFPKQITPVGHKPGSENNKPAPPAPSPIPLSAPASRPALQAVNSGSTGCSMQAHEEEIKVLRREHAGKIAQLNAQNADRIAQINAQHAAQIQQRKEAERELLEKLRRFYGDGFILQAYSGQPGTTLDQNQNPHRIEADGSDAYTFLISGNGKYHRTSCTHCGAAMKIPASRLDPKRYEPCKHCKPMIPDLQWLEDYMEINKRLR